MGDRAGTGRAVPVGLRGAGGGTEPLHGDIPMLCRNGRTLNGGTPRKGKSHLGVTLGPRLSPPPCWDPWGVNV